MSARYRIQDTSNWSKSWSITIKNYQQEKYDIQTCWQDDWFHDTRVIYNVNVLVPADLAFLWRPDLPISQGKIFSVVKIKIMYTRHARTLMYILLQPNPSTFTQFVASKFKRVTSSGGCTDMLWRVIQGWEEHEKTWQTKRGLRPSKMISSNTKLY